MNRIEWDHPAIIITMIVLAITIMILAISAPIAYMDGIGKAAWLKETKGMDLKWYEAAGVPLKIYDGEGEVSIKHEVLD
jgi:hypothetical protein